MYSRARNVQGPIKAQQAEAIDKSGRKEADPAAWLSK